MVRATIDGDACKTEKSRWEEEESWWEEEESWWGEAARWSSAGVGGAGGVCCKRRAWPSWLLRSSAAAIASGDGFGCGLREGRERGWMASRNRPAGTHTDIQQTAREKASRKELLVAHATGDTPSEVMGPCER